MEASGKELRERGSKFQGGGCGFRAIPFHENLRNFRLSQNTFDQEMPVAQLLNGVQLYYTDSGEPADPDYDTIVIVHGVAYNAGTL